MDAPQTTTPVALATPMDTDTPYYSVTNIKARAQKQIEETLARGETPHPFTVQQAKTGQRTISTSHEPISKKRKHDEKEPSRTQDAINTKTDTTNTTVTKTATKKRKRPLMDTDDDEDDPRGVPSYKRMYLEIFCNYRCKHCDPCPMETFTLLQPTDIEEFDEELADVITQAQEARHKLFYLLESRLKEGGVSTARMCL